MRYFLHLAYQGTNYSGWQRQIPVVSVQQIIEDCLSKMLKEKIHIHGCGRTDSGVHATQYFAHLDIKNSFDFNFVERINLMLPKDISIYELIPVPNDYHAQHDAQFRTYTYFLHLQKTPILLNTSSYYKIERLDLSSINEAIEILKQTIDFRSLCKSPDIYKHTRCNIKEIKFIELGFKKYKLEIKSNRFLRGMIRYIVARLLDIGTGKLAVKEFSATLSSLSAFGYKFQKPAYPQGLFLSKVEYPYLNRETNG